MQPAETCVQAIVASTLAHGKRWPRNGDHAEHGPFMRDEMRCTGLTSRTVMDDCPQA